MILFKIHSVLSLLPAQTSLDSIIMVMAILIIFLFFKRSRNILHQITSLAIEISEYLKADDL